MSRRFQFSLKWLFVAMFVVGATTAFCGSSLLARSRAIHVLDELGAAITYDYQWRRDGSWKPNAHAPGWPWLKRFLGENYYAKAIEVQLFTDAMMSPNRFTDEHAARIAALTDLEWLVLMDTQLTDDGLRRLTALRNLERLDLEGSRVTEAGVQEFQRSLPNVKVFH